MESRTFPDVNSEVRRFSDKSCKDFKLKEKSITLLYDKEEELKKILDMPWLVRRCLAEEKLPSAIKVLQAAQDMIKSVPDPPAVLAVSCFFVKLEA